MRDFILYVNNPIKPDFSLNDLPGSGRVDLIARCVSSALWLSHNVRRDTNIHICFETNGVRFVLSFFGLKIKRVSPDERNIASWIKKAIQIALENKERVQEGIIIRKIDIETFLNEFTGRDIVILKEEGVDIRKVELENPVFVLGDHLDIPENVLNIVKKFNPKIVSLGPKSYLASHAIVLVNNEMDRKLYNFT